MLQALIRVFCRTKGVGGFRQGIIFFDLETYWIASFVDLKTIQDALFLSGGQSSL